MAAHPHSSTTVLETAADWLTVTTHRPRILDRWQVHCTTLQKAEARAGAKSEAWHTNHYYGSACGRCRFGLSDKALLVSLSGQLAEDEFAYFWADHDTITRLDIAVTIRTVDYDADLGKRAYSEACAFRETNPRSAAVTLIQNADGGATVYIGKRSGSRFGRIYNKFAEQAEAKDQDGMLRYAHAWRIELELHDVDAQAVGMMLAEPGGHGARIRYYLARYLQTHGITVPYDPGQPAALPTGFRRRSDRETRLDWLSRTVRPTIDWLKTSCTPDELRSILGLNDGDA